MTQEEKAKAYDEAIEKAKVFKEHLLEINDKDYADEMDYIFPELAESEDEKTRRALLQFLNAHIGCSIAPAFCTQDIIKWIAWVEKQGEHANFRNKIQIGDKVTKNEDGVLVNLSQLSRVAKKDENQGEQKPAWREEDEIGLVDALWAIQQARTIAKDENDMGNIWYAENWLKSLKDRVQPQPKHEWSEDDKRKIGRIYSILGQAADTHAFSTSCRLIGDKECIELQDFLKSLRPQNRWKPSDEQMKALKESIGIVGELTPRGELLKELVEQLNELMEE